MWFLILETAIAHRRKTYIGSQYIVESIPYMYPLSGFDHWHALKSAMAHHKNAGYLLAPGTRCLVDGPCHDPGCDYGRIEVREYFVGNATWSRRWLY